MAEGSLEFASSPKLLHCEGDLQGAWPWYKIQLYLHFQNALKQPMQDANLPTSCSNHRTLIHYLDYVNSGNIFTVSWHCCPTQLSFCFSNPWPFLNKFNQFLYTALRHIKFFCWWLPWIKKELLLLHMMFQLRYCNKCWHNICTPWSTCDTSSPVPICSTDSAQSTPPYSTLLLWQEVQLC